MVMGFIVVLFLFVGLVGLMVFVGLRVGGHLAGNPERARAVFEDVVLPIFRGTPEEKEPEGRPDGSS